VLQSLQQNVVECLEYADGARAKAEAATIEADRAFWLNIGKRWRELAEAFQFQQRVDKFIKSPPPHGPPGEAASFGGSSLSPDSTFLATARVRP